MALRDFVAELPVFLLERALLLPSSTLQYSGLELPWTTDTQNLLAWLICSHIIQIEVLAP